MKHTKEEVIAWLEKEKPNDQYCPIPAQFLKQISQDLEAEEHGAPRHEYWEYESHFGGLLCAIRTDWENKPWNSAGTRIDFVWDPLEDRD